MGAALDAERLAHAAREDPLSLPGRGGLGRLTHAAREDLIMTVSTSDIDVFVGIGRR